MSDGVRVLDLEAIEARHAAVTDPGGKTKNWLAEVDASIGDVPALVAEVRRLREALDGLVKINAEDFPVVDSKVDWSVYPVTFGYATAFRDALLALGRSTP